MNKQNFKSQQGGFTLIELIVVIVILGIMAATALPKFNDMSTDARIAKMQAAAGAMKSAAASAHAAYLIAGSPTNNRITLEGQNYTLANGYPQANNIAAMAGLVNTDYRIQNGTGTVSDLNKTTCSVVYVPATATAPPTVNVSALATRSNC